MRTVTIASLLLFSAVGEAQEWTPSLKGSKASLRRQNIQADAEKLPRITNDRQLERLKRSGALVRIPKTFYLREKPDPRWPEKFRWLRPNAATFLDDLAAVYFEWFGVPLQVNSAVRTKDRQRRIIRARNFNAAAVDGERASPHLTGATMDISWWDRHKRRLPKDNMEFLQAYLLDMEARGYIEVSRELHQAVFHIMVFATYPARDLTRAPEARIASAPQ